MTAFIVSLVVMVLMTALIFVVGLRRPVGKPLSWGEAIVAAVYVFSLLFVAYGVVPHQWLALADNEFRWRNDKIGIPLGGLKVFGHHIFGMKPPYLLFPKGIPLPNGKFIVTAEVIRDFIEVGLYGVGIGGQLFMWSWWNKRGKRAAGTEVETSAYGRPLLRPIAASTGAES